jgi:signal transduction histidine kinase
VVAAVGAFNLAAAGPYIVMRHDRGLTYLGEVLMSLGLYLAVTGWGMYVRSRRQLLLSLRERARNAETEAALRAEGAQRLARERIAREMHDVLAHRLSLLSLHAGALEYRPDASPEEVARAAGVIRSSAHQALQDLREVIGVLRAPDGGAGPSEDGDRPQPTLADLPRLVEESRQAGMRVALEERVDDPGAVPSAAGRTAYRIAQEGLTNVRKHGRGAEAAVTVAGRPGDGLTVEVRNPVAVPRTASLARAASAAASGAGPVSHAGAVADNAPGPASAQIPGAGRGLIGLSERAALAGGRLEHGRTASGDFRLFAWLPWPA